MNNRDIINLCIGCDVLAWRCERDNGITRKELINYISRVLIKNFVSELMKKQQDLQSEEGMEEEEGEDGGEGDGDRDDVIEEREEEVHIKIR